MAGGLAIDGLISGMDTSAIISKLMELEGQQQASLKAKSQAAQQVINAYQSVNSKFVALQTAAKALTAPSAWQAMRATTSSGSVAASTATGAVPSSFTFDVTRLATKHSLVSTAAVDGLNATVAAAGSTIAIHRNGADDVLIETGDGSLGAVVAAINANKDAGIKAAAVQVAPGQYRLQLTSTQTGAASEFALVGLDADLGDFALLTQGTDAQIAVGSGTLGAYTVTSATNTFSDVLPGVSFTVSKVENGVTLTVAPDAQGLADKMQALVDAANATLAEMSRLSAYNAETKTGGPLVSDYTIRDLTQRISGAVSALAGNGTTSKTVGVELTKAGTLTFDRDAFLAAYAADPDKVQRTVAPSTNVAPADGLTGGISVIAASDSTRPGSYEIVVTQAARQASTTLDLSAGVDAGQIITLSIGGKTVAYTADGTEDASSLASALTEAAAEEHLDLTVSVEGGKLVVRSGGYGTAQNLSVDVTDGALQVGEVVEGRDVAGTINGVEAQGQGQMLSTAPGTAQVGAVTLKVTLTEDDVSSLAGAVAGTLVHQAGLAQRLATIANDATDSDRGSLTNAINGRTKTKNSLDELVSGWDLRLQMRRAALQRQYAALEVALGKMQQQSSWLAGQLGGIAQFNYGGGK